MAYKNLVYFGYVKKDDNPCGFFDFDYKYVLEDVNFNGFLKLNEITLEFVTQNIE